MARRRPLVIAASPAPEIPERLRNPLVEDWVTPAEVAVVRADLATSTINGHPAADDVQQVLWELQMRARSRVRDARCLWAADNGIEARKLSSGHYGHAWPSYRDESVFLAEIRRAIVSQRH